MCSCAIEHHGPEYQSNFYFNLYAGFVLVIKEKDLVLLKVIKQRLRAALRREKDSTAKLDRYRVSDKAALRREKDSTAKLDRYRVSDKAALRREKDSTAKLDRYRVSRMSQAPIFMLNSTKHGIYPAHKYYTANNCWHFNIYQQDKYNI